MKRKMDTRRGIAIELAVGVMLIMMALSILLVTGAVVQTAHRRSDLEDFEETLGLYGVTDHILREPTAEAYGEYTIERENNCYIIKTPNGDVALQIIVEDGVIVSWQD